MKKIHLVLVHLAITMPLLTLQDKKRKRKNSFYDIFCDGTLQTSKAMLCAGLNVLAVCARTHEQLFRMCKGVKTVTGTPPLHKNKDLLQEDGGSDACTELQWGMQLL